MLIADYAVLGPDSKLTAVGAGWQVTQGVPAPSPTGVGAPPQSIVAIVEVPQELAGDQVALTLTFRDSAGQPVLMPAPEGAEPQPLRVAQLAVLQRPSVPGAYLPPSVRCRIGLVFGIPAGLPVTPNETYQWTLHIDDETRPEWTADFYLLGPNPGPVLG
jgi:hypothetical protein